MCSQAQTPAHSASVSPCPCCHTGEVVAQVSQTLTLNPRLNPNLNQERSLLKFLKERKSSVKLDPQNPNPKP
jgi:adenine C2-methylase RlmN of 23S rRNA A2503 and tRNA A37